MNKKLIKKIILLTAAAAAVFVVIRLRSNADIPVKNGPYYVEWVIDGDTVSVVIDGEKVRVRALCMDAPESVAPEESEKENTEEGILASERAGELLYGKEVYLEYDRQMYDQYGRTLAYIYLEDGSSFEEIMISEGLARAMEIMPNNRHYNGYLGLEQKAKRSKAGFWGTGFYR